MKKKKRRMVSCAVQSDKTMKIFRLWTPQQGKIEEGNLSNIFQ